MSLTKETVESRLQRALGRLIDHDGYLLEKDVNERSISHRLAIYIEQEFAGWNVDCEYNRDQHDPKKLGIRSGVVSNDDLTASTVFPDIIVHKRGTNENLLVIEMKKESHSEEAKEFDRDKLNAFKSELKYKYAVLVIASNSAKLPECEWIE